MRGKQQGQLEATTFMECERTRPHVGETPTVREAYPCWSVSVAAVPELPKVDLSQPVEIDIIDAERYVLFYLEVTAVA